MKKTDIVNYDFVDCLLVDFGVDKLLSTLYIIVEAYYPTSTGNYRKKGLVKIVFCGITKIIIDKKEEFESDILSSYDKGGNDIKANEIYSIGISCMDDGQFKGEIKTDMLYVETEYKEMSLIEIG